MTKFSEFVNEDISKKVKKEEKQKEDISKLIDKYSTYNESDLMQEFLKESIKKKENGELDNDNLLRVKNILTPYLNEDQKEKLNNLLNMVK